MKLPGIKELGQKPYFIVPIFLILAGLMISSGFLELTQSRRNLRQLMESQSHTLLESITIASRNSLLSNEYLEEISRQRLLDNANIVRSLYRDGFISEDFLDRFRKENSLSSICIYAGEGHITHCSSGSGAADPGVPEIRSGELQDIFNGVSDTLILGLRNIGDTYQYTVALATGDRHAVTVSLDAERFLQIRRSTGFGTMLNQVADENNQIRYIAFQDPDGILAATGNVTALEAIEASPFLSRSLTDSLYMSRVTSFDGHRIFEVAHPFTYLGETVGLIRIGLSTEPLREINRRIIRNMAISTAVLVFVGFVLITFLFIRQRLALVQKEFRVVESYSAGILESVSDAILVYDRDDHMRIFNAAAEDLFGIPREVALSRSVTDLFSEEQCNELFEPVDPVRQVTCRIADQLKYLLLSRSTFRDADGLEYVILVVRDQTEQKQMEEQVQRKQRLSAMGELASGVAHEIRNPLNAIGTIVQQLRKDFVPGNQQEEYDELTRIVYEEVQRINGTIQEFLRFSRPEPVLPVKFDPAALLKELARQYGPVLEEKQIDLDIRAEWKGEVTWDRNQIKQVLINLLQNAIEAIGQEGRIQIHLGEYKGNGLFLTISDNGPGMDAGTKEKLFNLYFTTKPSGTGIGLSLVQRIVYEHNGMISVESETGKGTSFTIRLPVHVKG